jgi:hypothetical protein
MTDATHDEVATRWVQGLRGDWAVLEDLSAPTMRVWHSHDDRWLTREGSEARLAESGAAGSPPAFDDIRAVATTTGFVVQASVDGPDGSGRMHIVQVCTVIDGHVAACEEYIAPEMGLA